MDAPKNKILYIDDEIENLSGFKYSFRKSYEVFTALSAEDGLKILAEEDIKVILSDQRMPKISGTQLLKKVAKEYPDVYRIILTAYTDAQDIIDAINKGKIYQFIRKPWDREEVKIIIDNAIRLYDLKKQNKELVKSLKESNNKLENVNSQLEEKVKERTREIEEKNQELEKHHSHLEELVKQRTREMEIAKEKAIESDKLKSSFLANVSHEIRTPMNAIIGFTELLLLDEYDDNEKKDFKENIVFNTESLLRLIDDILDISKIEANQLTIKYEDQNLKTMMADLGHISQRQKEIYDKPGLDIYIETPFGENDFYFSTDKVRLNQILSNLVSNAIKFTDTGYVKTGIKIINKGPDINALLFYVEDTGIGISDEALRYIFDRFRKADINSPKLFRGAGLGLYIVKSLVEKFNGQIWVESSEGKGTNFYFQIPFKKASGEQNDYLAALNKDIPDFSSKTILIAEDEDSSYYLIENLLRRTKANTVRAHNGNEVIQNLQLIDKVDLILMDMQMPGMNGIEATAIIKREYKDIPIIAQTAYAFPEQRQEILKAGCDDIIHKPFKIHEFLNTVSGFLCRENV